MGLLEAGLTGGLSLLGQAQANKANAKQAALNRDFQHNEAQAQMEFQERMSNSAYQRATKDMMSAGINPIMAYQQGGASSPAGASGGGSQAAPMDSALDKGVSSAIDRLRLERERDANQIQRDTANSNIQLNSTQGQLNKAAAVAAGAAARASTANARAANRNAEALEYQMPAIQSKSRYEDSKSQLDEQMLPWDGIMNRAGNVMGLLSSGKDLLKAKPTIKFGGAEQVLTGERSSAPWERNLPNTTYKPGGSWNPIHNIDPSSHK